MADREGNLLIYCLYSDLAVKSRLLIPQTDPGSKISTVYKGGEAARITMKQSGAKNPARLMNQPLGSRCLQDSVGALQFCLLS